MNVPDKLNFAQEVRAERLIVLWQATVVLCFGLVWMVLVGAAAGVVNPVDLLIPVGIIIVCCILCHLLLRCSLYEFAVYAYLAGLILGVGWLVWSPGGTFGADRVEFGLAFPLVIVIAGFFLPVSSMLVVFVLSVIVQLGAPSLGRTPTINDIQMFSVFMTAIAAGIAGQLSGALYGIAEWALESYRKERETKEQLFDSQKEVERSFLRQKALSEKLQDTNAELELAREAAVEAKNFRGQFLANMSHELRTPLNAIIGFSETMLNFPMMYENESLPPIYRNDLGQIYTSGKHLLQLINDILDLSKVDAGKLDLEIEQVDLEPILKGVVATTSGLIGNKSIKVKRDIPAKLPAVRGDSLRVRQVILNLLSNAAKFTDEGQITIGARDDGNGEVTIWIADTGIGIAPQDMDYIFEEFRQGMSGRRKGRAGSGLGLAISRQLLNLMNGRIWVESTLNKGSTFYFTLPVYASEPVEAQG